MYEAARQAFDRNQDRENLANNLTRQSGILRLFGDYERGWRAAFKAQRHAPYLVEVQSRHHLLGETAALASALDYPQMALLYQTTAVRAIRDELAKTAADHRQKIRGLRGHLSIALRARADFQLRLGRQGQAQQDLEEALRLATMDPDSVDEDIQRALFARAQAVQGRTHLNSRPPDPRRAIAALSQALSLAELSTAVRFRTFRATLFVERAKAFKMAGQRQEARQDLQRAIDELREEEAGILAQRRKGKREELWSPYFARSQDTYRLLIRQLAEDGRKAEAFLYAEKARAFEPLDLVLRLDVTPQAFTKLARNGALDLERIQACLPRATFLLEYTVLEDSTLVWIVSRDHFEMLKLPVRRAAIEEWTKTLQREAGKRHAHEVEAALYMPYDKLLATPLGRIAKRPDSGEEDRRLVFVPDGAMHGLPFAALRNRQSDRYVIEDFTVSVAASATLYVFSLLRDEELSPAAAPRALLVGDPAFNDRSEVTLQVIPG